MAVQRTWAICQAPAAGCLIIHQPWGCGARPAHLREPITVRIEICWTFVVWLHQVLNFSLNHLVSSLRLRCYIESINVMCFSEAGTVCITLNSKSPKAPTISGKLTGKITSVRARYYAVILPKSLTLRELRGYLPYFVIKFFENR